MERRRESAEVAALSITWTVFFFLYLEGFIGVKEDGRQSLPAMYVGRKKGDVLFYYDVSSVLFQQVQQAQASYVWE